MDPFFWLVFGAAISAAGFLEWGNRKGGVSKAWDADFRRFKNNYLVVFALMMAGDWLQGPYVYALYQHYGFSRGQIGRLFIAGFGSSMIFGTFAGAMADRHGRKRAALAYAMLYSAACATKHSPDGRVLLAGRVLCGISTSLLYSAFEAWLVAEHSARGFSAESLSAIFSQAAFLGNGAVAIASGLAAHALVEGAGLGPVAPFDAAALALALGGTIVFFTWRENRGADAGGDATLAAPSRDISPPVAKDQGRGAGGALVSCTPTAPVPGSPISGAAAGDDASGDRASPLVGDDGLVSAAELGSAPLPGADSSPVHGRHGRVSARVGGFAVSSPADAARFQAGQEGSRGASPAVVALAPARVAAPGAPSALANAWGDLSAAARLILADPRIALLGAMQSLFEASMYTFVFLWTPALAPTGEKVPHGMVFACFMACSAAGSALAGRLLASGSAGADSAAAEGFDSGDRDAEAEPLEGKRVAGDAAPQPPAIADGLGHHRVGPSAPARGAARRGDGPSRCSAWRVDRYMQVVFAFAAVCLFVPVFFHGEGRAWPTADQSGSLLFAGKVQLLAFCLFEVCVGAFWPSVATQRAGALPEHARATVLNLFRIPLNAFVCIALAHIDTLALPRAFGMCSVFLLAAAVCQRHLSAIALHLERAGTHA